jgi:hypothetical protein
LNDKEDEDEDEEDSDDDLVRQHNAIIGFDVLS